MVVEQQPPQDLISLSFLNREKSAMGTRQILENGAAPRKRTPVFQLKHRQLTHFIQVFLECRFARGVKEIDEPRFPADPNRLSIKATL